MKSLTLQKLSVKTLVSEDQDITFLLVLLNPIRFEGDVFCRCFVAVVTELTTVETGAQKSFPG